MRLPKAHCCLRRLIAEYMQAAPRSAVAEAVETLAGPALLRMVHTRHGALVACYVLAFGTAKDRKKAVKAMKGANPHRACASLPESAGSLSVHVCVVEVFRHAAQGMCTP